MPNAIDLDLLAAFVAVAEERHFGRGAQRLHLAQPVISRRIQRLEAAVGVALIERTTRHVALTEAGTAFLDDARQLLHDVDLSIARARRVAQGLLGSLTIGFVESAAFELLAPLLRQLATRVPDVTLELRELSTEQQLADLSVDVDIAIVRELGTHDLEGEGLASQPLLVERLHAAMPAAHRLAERRTVHLAELSELPFVLFPRPPVPRLHDHLLAVCAEAGFQPNVSAHASQYPTMLAMVAAARGIALVPACARAIRPDDVRLVPIVESYATTSLSLAWRDPVTPALETFIDAALDIASSASATELRSTSAS